MEPNKVPTSPRTSILRRKPFDESQLPWELLHNYVSGKWAQEESAFI